MLNSGTGIVFLLTTGLLAAVPLAACRQPGSPAPDGSPSTPPAGSPSPLTVEEVYRRVEGTIRRPGLIYHATVQVESDQGFFAGSGETRQWVDAHRAVAREEVDLLPLAGLPGPWTTSTILTAEGRFARQPDGKVTATSPWRCHGAGIAASAVLGCPGPTERSTTEVQFGDYAGQSAIILVTTGSWSSSDARHQFTKRLYLDPDTYLPRALESEGQVDFGQVKPTFERRVYRHEFIALGAMPNDFFDPAAIGYVRTDPAEPLNRPTSDLTVHWLDREFPGVGDLPPLVLAKVDEPLGGGPGYRFLLRYARADDRFGPPVVTLQLWPRAAWDAVIAQGKGRPGWEHPCWQRSDINLPEGLATIFAGYSSAAAGVPDGPLPESGPCPDAPPNSFDAHAHLGQTVVLVDAPGASSPAGQVASPYDSRAGMEAVVRALRPRE